MHTFSTKKHEMPFGPGSPVLAITKYTSLTPPPLINACSERGHNSLQNSVTQILLIPNRSIIFTDLAILCQL